MTPITPDFVWKMEDVLDLYEEDYDAKKPVVSLDERPCKLIEDIYSPVPALLHKSVHLGHRDDDWLSKLEETV